MRASSTLAAWIAVLASVPLYSQTVQGSSKPEVEVKVEQRAEEVSRLEIPQELGPAISPYLVCRLKAAGIRMPRPDGTLPDTAEPSGEDCRPIRKIARRNGLNWLEENTDLEPHQRAKEVDRTLNDVDRFVEVGKPKVSTSSPDETGRK